MVFLCQTVQLSVALDGIYMQMGSVPLCPECYECRSNGETTRGQGGLWNWAKRISAGVVGGGAASKSVYLVSNMRREA